jgi:hypothetical protein
MVDVRGVAARIEQERLDRSRHARLNRFNLSRRSVFIVQPLDDQRRAGDRGQHAFDVPAAECITQPDVAPRLEQDVTVQPMMSLEA